MKPVEIEIIMRDRTKEGLSQVSAGMDGVQQDTDMTIRLVRELEKQLEQLQQQSKNASPEIDQSANIAMIEAMKSKIEELRSEVDSLKAELGGLDTEVQKTKVIPTDLLKAKSQFNGLNMSIQQIAREMPALAMGPQMFFLAISNNLPILSDEITRAKREYEELLKTGQKGTPVWKQVISSLFSWQTAMTTGIMLLVMYGKDIINWTKSLMGSKSALEETREAMQKKLEVEKEAHSISLKNRFELEKTIQALKNFKGDKDEERKKVEELNQKYGEAFGYYSTLAQWYDTLQTKAEDYIQILFLQAKAQGLISQAIKDDEKVNEVKSKGVEEHRPFFGAGGKAYMFLGGGNTNQYGSDPAKLEYDKQLKAAEQAREESLAAAEDFQKQMEQIQNKSGIDIVVSGSVEDIENSIALKQKALKKLTNKADYDKAMQDIKDDEKRLEAIKGEKNKNEKKSVPENDVNDYRVEAERRVQEQIVALKKEGTDKKKAQAKLDYDNELARIGEEEKGLLSRYAELKKAGVQVKPEEVRHVQATYNSQREYAGEIYKGKVDNVDTDESQKNEDKFKKILDDYQTYADKRKAIEEKYQKDVAELQKQNGSGEYDGNIQQVEVERDEELARIDMELARREAAFTVWADGIATLGLKELRSALQTAQDTLGKSDNKTSDKDKAVLRSKIQTLQKSLEVAEAKDGNESSSKKSEKKWKDTLKVMNDVSDTVNNIVADFEGLDETTKTALTASMNISGGIIAMITGIQALSVTGAEAIKGVERASVILAIVGTAIQIITTLFSLTSKAEKEHHEALQEVAKSKIDMQREYNLLLLEQNLLMKEAESIFGEDQIAKAVKAVEVYRDAIKAYKEELVGNAPVRNKQESMAYNFFGIELDSYKKKIENYKTGLGALMNDVQVKTGSYTTGAWFWKKQHDVMTPVLEVYKDLVDEEGNLNVERAKAIIETQSMSDESKAQLQALIDLQEQAEEAQEALRSYLQDTFGSLGDGIMDSLSNAIINEGTDAWKEFGKAGADVLEDLGKQIAYSLFFAEKFKKLQADLEKIYGSGKTEEEIARESMKLVGEFYEGIGKDMDSAQAWMEQWKESAAEHGMDLWTKDEGDSQSGRAGAFTTMSQEQGTKLEGLFTSVQDHTSSIDEKMTDICKFMFDSFDVLSQIAENTENCKYLLQMAEDIRVLRRDGIKTN